MKQEEAPAGTGSMYWKNEDLHLVCTTGGEETFPSPVSNRVRALCPCSLLKRDPGSISEPGSCRLVFTENLRLCGLLNNRLFNIMNLQFKKGFDRKIVRER